MQSKIEKSQVEPDLVRLLFLCYVFFHVVIVFI
jgi:phage shock protein PspC (stress-responsive transcriptional regulator)